MTSSGKPPNNGERHGRQVRSPNYRPVELTPEQREKKYGRRFRYQLTLRNEGKRYSKELLDYFWRGLTGFDSEFDDDDDD